MKKKLFLLFFSACLCITGCSSISSQSNTDTETVTESFDIDLYKTTISNYNDAIMDETLILYNMGKYQYNYWETLEELNGDIKYDSLVSKAYDWLAEENGTEQTDIENNYSNICSLYQDIVLTEAADNDVEELKAAVKDLHYTFELLYQLVTAPSGDIESFATNFNDHITNIKAQNTVLSTLLE